VEGSVATNGSLLLACDRAIRSQAHKDADVGRGKLEAQLPENVRPLRVPGAAQDRD